MTGKYRIDLYVKDTRLTAGVRAEIVAKRWSTFVATCESLHRDGLSYSVEFCYFDTQFPVIRILAAGTYAKRRRSNSKPSILPPPVPQAVAKQRADFAEFFVEGKHRSYPHGPKKHKAQYWELSKIAQQGREFIEAELAYWRELELLSGQRQHNKPGKTADNQYADDGIAA